MLTLGPAGSEDMDAVRALFRDYAAFLAVDLCFQDFEGELAGLPGKYAPPGGAILLARDGEAVAGGVALRPCPEAGADACEMKRLYVRPHWQGSGTGRRLAEAIVAEGRRLGYRRMVLDTLERLDTAVAMYRRMGFTDIAPYYHNPTPGVVYLELHL